MCIYIKNSMYNLTPYNTRIIGKSDKNIYTFGIIVFIGLLFVSIIKNPTPLLDPKNVSQNSKSGRLQIEDLHFPAILSRRWLAAG